MAKDRRYAAVKNLITTGYIKSFRDIFDIIPKSVVARDLGMNNVRFTALMANVDKFLLKDIFLIASFIEVDEDIMMGLILQQYILDKKTKKKVK
jgi:hypothetical protein